MVRTVVGHARVGPLHLGEVVGRSLEVGINVLLGGPGAIVPGPVGHGRRPRGLGLDP